MSPAICAKDLGKRYRVQHTGPRGRYAYRTLRDDLVRLVSDPFRRLWTRTSSACEQDFWALHDVSFEVQPGEAVGIIGRNGAGKSTLLKILSRITKPTTGSADLRGRVGSLLEVGTGFHPELTGRDNIFLNGAILGMSRREIQRQFDEIVAFAEIEQFLDTPVKRYSSGMYVRLAFAVAAHLEPEILIVDEVLAVGDIGFQRKCMGRMREVGKGGCTVLFVSHNMPAIETLCSRAILLDRGRLIQDGKIHDVIRDYHRRIMVPHGNGGAEAFECDSADRERKIFRSVALLDPQGAPTNHVSLGGSFHLRICLETTEKLEYPQMGVGIDDSLGQRILTVHTPTANCAVPSIIPGKCEVDCRVPQLPLAPGDYWVKLGITIRGHQIDNVERALHFSVVDGDTFGEGRGHSKGVCIAASNWSLVPAHRHQDLSSKLDQ
jgi:lipopolysaccharide transport system ATP-binding protein